MGRRTEEGPISTTSTGGPPSAATPARAPAAGPRRGGAFGWLAGHLTLVAILLPVVFVVGLEAIRYAVAGPAPDSTPPWQGFHLLIVFVMVGGIVAFSLAMFHVIDRAQAALLWQNRELAATNAVSRAIQGEAGVERIIDAALAIVLDATGAAYASVAVFGPAGEGSDRVVSHTRFSAHQPPVNDADVDDDPSVEVPLTTGQHTVGRLSLWLLRDTTEPLGMAAETLRTIGSQLASAIQLAQAVDDLHRRKNEGHAFYDILLRISHHAPPVEILDAVVRHARERLSCDAVVLTLTDEAARAVQFAGGPGEDGGSLPAVTRFASGAEVADPDHARRPGDGWLSEAVAAVTGPMDVLGELWVARRDGDELTDRDRGFLTTLSGFAAIAITSAQLRENGRQRAVLAERERIAREMHDSLAQVLGATHLRLRSLELAPAVEADPVVVGEISDLAQTCHEAYLDVREAILGLRDSSKTERGLEGTLASYLEKYARQSGVSCRLDNRLDRGLSLSPRCEVHIIRVIQEALTNVRKHAGASEVVVTVDEEGSLTRFVVEDDGAGFDMRSQEGDGFGLFTMRDRMALLHGSLTVDSVPGRGTRVIASVPERSVPRPVSTR